MVIARRNSEATLVRYGVVDWLMPDAPSGSK